MYPQSMFCAKIKKNIESFYLKMNIFTAVKYFCILHGRVCVMYTLKAVTKTKVLISLHGSASDLHLCFNSYPKEKFSS